MKSWDWLESERADWARLGLARQRRTCRPLGNGWSEIDGRRLRDFSGNDYLGLAGDQRLVGAAKRAMELAGIGARGSALICGRTPWHEELERSLAEFENQPAAILFPTGMAANVGTISTLVRPGDTVFCDRWNHASLIDGCRLSGARLQVYRHDKLDHFARRLSNETSRGRRWIVTDTVFSMDGDLAPLQELCDLSEKYDLRLIVDEAHATGIFGANGRGVCEHFGVEHRVDVRIGTLSKALGCLGGFLAGPQVLIDSLWNAARPQMFSTALPAGICAAAGAAIAIVREEPERRARLLQMCHQFRELLAAGEVQVAPGAVGPIVPVVIGDPEKTVAMAARLASRGFFVGAIRPPTVSKTTSRLRISLTLMHDQSAIEELADAVIQEIALHEKFA